MMIGRIVWGHRRLAMPSEPLSFLGISGPWTKLPSTMGLPVHLSKSSNIALPTAWEGRMTTCWSSNTSPSTQLNQLELGSSTSTKVASRGGPTQRECSWEIFCGTCKHSSNHQELKSCNEQIDKALREYIKRFSRCYNELHNVSDTNIIGVYGTTNKALVHTLGCSSDNCLKRVNSQQLEKSILETNEIPNQRLDQYNQYRQEK